MATEVKVMNSNGAVKVVESSRRKQKWIRTPTPIPPTPPGSPSVLPEPLLDELLELWVGVGMDEPSYKQHDISLKSALDSLEFDDEDTFHIVGEYGGDSDTGNENEELLNRLLDRHHFDDSPPPTNPASPREFRDQEVEIQSEEEAYTVTAVETEYYNAVEEEELTETVVCSVIEDEGEEEAVEMDLEEFDAFPKTEPITSEFSSHFFDSYFDSAFPDLEERTTGLLAEEEEVEETTTATTIEETPIDNSETISSIINYGKPDNFSDEVEIKHDCMWAGSCESDSHQKDFEELFGTSLAPRIDSFFGEDDHYGDIIQTTTSSTPEEEQEMDEELEEIDTNLEVLRSKILGDHSYAFSGYGPVHQNSQSSPASASPQSITQSAAATLLSSTAQTPHTIPGIVIKQEESSPKKTKIIVPLKDLMETLKQKSFYVSPGGPGKSVIRLTGNGETVRGVFELAKCKQNGSVGLALNGSSFTTASGAKGTFSVKKSNPKLKKAIHKPKQELSSCHSTTNSSRTTTTSSIGFNLQQSNGSCNSNSSCNSHNSGCSLTSSSSSVHSSASSPSSSLSGTPSGKPRKTKTHNNMERMRRIDLRNSFDTLRKLVPVLSKANKCSKVEILKSATEFINGLKGLEKKISKEEQALRSRNEALRSRLAALTSTST